MLNLMTTARRALRLAAGIALAASGVTLAQAAPETFGYTGSIVTWTVPTTGTYRVTAIGAQGGSGDAVRSGGRGARITGEFDLTAGDVYHIAVGGMGQASTYTSGISRSGGGGGGTFFVQASGAHPLLVAGGGGGLRWNAEQNGTDASVSVYGMTGSGAASTYTPVVKSSGLGQGGSVSAGTYGAGGGGFFGDGANDSVYGASGKGWTNGMLGGAATSSCTSNYGANGGFGGGGSGNGCSGGGGGGGYSGGDGGFIAGGGGSYNAGANRVALAGVGTGNGTLTIELIGVPALSITTPGDIVFIGDEGGGNWVLASSYSIYSFSNTGAGNLTWTIGAPAWLSVEPAAGSLGPGGIDHFTPSVNAAANALTPGTYTGVVTMDSDGGSETRNALLIVNDITAPVLATTPGNIAVSTDAGLATAVVTYTTPTFTDNVAVSVVVQTAGLASGSVFPLGVTTNTFRATDAAGNFTDETFTVTVTDTEDPVVSASTTNISVPTDAGENSAVVTYTAPAFADNVGVDSVVQTAGLASGAMFPLGVTTNTFRATDAAGNFADSSFTVTVTDEEQPALVSGPSNIAVNTDPGLATAVVTYATPTFTDNVGVASVIRTAGLASGAAFPIGVNAVTHRATDDEGNFTDYSFSVTVTDAEPPELVDVPADITINVNYPATSGVASWTAPTATDNAPGASVAQIAGPASGSSFPLGSTTITYRATDAAGNMADASFTVTITQTPPGSVTLVVNTGEDGSFGFTSDAPGLSGTVTTSGGAGSRGPIAIASGTYTLAFTVPSGFGVTSASCTNGGTLSATTMTGTLNLASGGDVVCTVTTVDALGETAAALGSYLEHRANLIVQNAPDRARRIDRLSGGGGGTGGTGGISGFGVSLGQGALPFSMSLSADEVRFSTSLLGVNRMDRTAMRSTAPQPRSESITDPFGDHLFGLAGQRLMLAPLQAANANQPASNEAVVQANAADALGAATGQFDPMDHRFDLWVEGRFARFDAAGGEGDFGILHVGADYLVTPNLLVGLGFQYDWLREDTQIGGEVDGDGFLAGPYLTARISERVFIDLRAAWGQGETDISPFGTYVDTVDSSRSLFSAAVIGDFQSGAWTIRPEVRLTRYEETTKAYVDSLNVDIPSFQIVSGFIEFGPEIGYQIALEDGASLRPSLTLQGIWTFDQENTATVPSNAPGLADTGLRARTEFGLAYQSRDFALALSAFYDGIGDNDYEAWGGRIRLNFGF